jgi:hypothetical protein
MGYHLLVFFKKNNQTLLFEVFADCQRELSQSICNFDEGALVQEKLAIYDKHSLTVAEMLSLLKLAKAKNIVFPSLDDMIEYAYSYYYELIAELAQNRIHLHHIELHQKPN